MEPGRVPALLEALFVYVKAEGVDKATKAALGLCNKHFKNLVDATVVEAWIDSDDLNLDLNALLNTKWHGLAALYIWESNPCQKCQTELSSALFVKFSRLETLVLDGCVSLKALPTEIGDLQHLKVLIMHSCLAIKVLPSSVGQLTTLEEIQLDYCGLTTDGLAPLQHLTGLTTLDLANNVAHGNLFEYPDFICNLTSLKELILYSDSITTLPDALGNLTNLESLTIRLWTDLKSCLNLLVI
jgi:Leucine-rich repeat (LRR) protein